MIDEGTVMQIFYDAMLTALKLAAPVLIISVLVGLVISIMQAATQIHEQTLTFVPKLIAVAVVLLLLGPWMIKLMTDFMRTLFDAIAIYT